MSSRFLRESIVYICPECATTESIKVYRFGEWVYVDAAELYMILIRNHKIVARFCDECENEYPLGIC